MGYTPYYRSKKGVCIAGYQGCEQVYTVGKNKNANDIKTHFDDYINICAI